MLGADAALTRHGRCQAWQRWIDAKASSSSSQWHVALMRHDKIATGPGNYRYSGWLRGLAFPAIVVVQRRIAASLLASIDGPPRSVSRPLAAHVNLDLTRLGFFTRRQADRQNTIFVLSRDLRCIDR